MREMKGINIALKIMKTKRNLFKNYMKVARELKVAFSEVLGEDVKVIVFGSVVRGDSTPLSDLDVLVVSRKADCVRYSDVVDAVEEKIGEMLGVEIHFVTPDVFEKWYRKFLDVFVEV